MGAVKLADNVASIDLGRCIGCGLCVPTCPENAIKLAKKAKEIVPPATEEDLNDAIMALKRMQ
jgi:formate hydrogenlyase subunit 6/NADH:ubiquinone oxidoreductase subunit I